MQILICHIFLCDKVQLVIYESFSFISAFTAYMRVTFPPILNVISKPKAFTANIMGMMGYKGGIMSCEAQDIRSMKDLSDV